MPSEKQHETQWQQNQLLLNELENAGQYPDWIVTVAMMDPAKLAEGLVQFGVNTTTEIRRLYLW